jgi:phosphoenolpyruvate carboxykinase (ATP)
MTETFNLLDYGINPKEVIRNAAPSKLYALAVKYEPEAEITSSGALSLKSGSKTGRSPKDKRIIERSESVNDIWWGNVNIKMDEHTFDIDKEPSIISIPVPEFTWWTVLLVGTLNIR